MKLPGSRRDDTSEPVADEPDDASLPREDDAAPAEAEADEVETDAGADTDADSDTDTDADSDTDTDADEVRPVRPAVPVNRAATLTAVLVALVLALGGVAALVGGSHELEPHDLRIGVAAQPQVFDALQDAVAKNAPDAFELVREPDALAGPGLVKDRSVYAFLIVDGNGWTLQYSTANSRLANQQVIGAFTPAGDTNFTPLDVSKAAAGDTSGLTIFFLVLGLVVAGFFAGQLLAPHRATASWRRAAAPLLLFSVLAGALSFVVVHVGFDALSGGVGVAVIILALLSFAVGAVTLVLVRYLRGVGAGIAALVLLGLGLATSGAILPPDYLPSLLRPLVDVLPPGLAAQGLSGNAYFGGSDVPRALVGLLLWAVVALALVAFADRRAARGDADA